MCFMHSIRISILVATHVIPVALYVLVQLALCFSTTSVSPSLGIVAGKHDSQLHPLQVLMNTA